MANFNVIIFSAIFIHTLFETSGFLVWKFRSYVEKYWEFVLRTLQIFIWATDSKPFRMKITLGIYQILFGFNFISYFFGIPTNAVFRKEWHYFKLKYLYNSIRYNNKINHGLKQECKCFYFCVLFRHEVLLSLHTSNP